MFLTAGAVSVYLSAGFAAGLGVHLQELLATAPEKFALHMKLFVPCQLLWAAANSCIKCSILSLYIVLFPNKIFVRFCYGTMIITAAYFIMVLIETFCLCQPVQYNWDKSINGKCVGENTAYLIAGIVNLLIDTFIVILPMPQVFRLQMTLVKRISIAGMFGLGAVICIISLLRIVWLYTWDLSDLTYTVTPGAIYTVLEPTLGVVNACLPTIKPAIVKLFGSKALNWTRHDRSKNSGRSGSTPQASGRSQRKVKGNITRDFERLDDEFPLNEIRIETGDHAGNNFENGGSNNIHVDRVFSVNNDEYSSHTLPGQYGSGAVPTSESQRLQS